MSAKQRSSVTVDQTSFPSQVTVVSSTSPFSDLRPRATNSLHKSKDVELKRAQSYGGCPINCILEVSSHYREGQWGFSTARLR